jgi:hypothetical protein
VSCYERRVAVGGWWATGQLTAAVQDSEDTVGMDKRRKVRLVRTCMVEVQVAKTWAWS